MVNPSKNEMRIELENTASLSPEDYTFIPGSDDSVVIDFLSYIRGQKLDTKTNETDSGNSAGSIWTFGMMVKEAFERLLRKYPSVSLFHFVFDSYCDNSLKGGERAMRKKAAGGVIRLAQIREDTKIPQQMEKFWACSENKQKFQLFVRDFISDLAQKIQKPVVMSGIIENDIFQPAMYINQLGNVTKLDELNLQLEEADLRLIPHIGWDILTFKRKCITVISEDTDVLVLLLHYFESLTKLGLQFLYLQMGRGEKRRMLPVHKMYLNLGKDLCATVLKAHIGSGCDHLSKLGTKRSCLLAHPEQVLKDFGKTALLDELQIEKAEEYLVKVFSGNNAAVKTFDELRVIAYKRNGSALDLPPTSHSIKNGHVKRWWYLYKMSSKLLQVEDDNITLDPCNYGWESIEGDLYALKELKLLPDNLCKTCKCKSGCKSKQCSCVKYKGKCTDFCLCVGCKNT